MICLEILSCFIDTDEGGAVAGTVVVVILALIIVTVIILLLIHRLKRDWLRGSLADKIDVILRISPTEESINGRHSVKFLLA